MLLSPTGVIFGVLICGGGCTTGDAFNACKMFDKYMRDGLLYLYIVVEHSGDKFYIYLCQV